MSRTGGGVAPDGAVSAIPREDRFRARGEVRWTSIGRWRTAALVAVHLAVIAHVAQWRLSGTTISPLEPSEVQETLKIGYVNAGAIVFAASILITALVGRFFCGWVCHFVAYQDLCAWLLRRLGLKPRPVRSRLLMFVPAFAALYMFVGPLVERWWYEAPALELQLQLTTERFWATFPGLGMAILTIALGGFLMVYWLGAKGFCSYGCPYGAVFGLVDRVAPLRVKVNDSCETCGHCTTVCSSNVRVHEEVARYRMVVDPGCMKTMDCVNSCPKQALHLGFAMRPLRAETRRRRSPGADFTWGEELVMAVAGLAAFFVYRGFLNHVPFLLAICLGVSFAIAVLTGIRLLRVRDLRFQHHELRRAGRLTRAGRIAAATVLAFVALTAYAAVIRGYGWSADRSFEAAVAASDAAERTRHLDASAAALETAYRLGWCEDTHVLMSLAIVDRWRRRNAEAETRLRHVLELEPDALPALVHLADVVIERGEELEAEALVTRALAIRAEYPPAKERLEKLRLRREREQRR